MAAGRPRYEADLGGFVEPLQDRVNGGQIIGVAGEVHADVVQSITHLDGRQRQAASQYEPAGVGESERHGRCQPEQPR